MIRHHSPETLYLIQVVNEATVEEAYAVVKGSPLAALLQQHIEIKLLLITNVCDNGNSQCFHWPFSTIVNTVFIFHLVTVCM